MKPPKLPLKILAVTCAVLAGIILLGVLRSNTVGLTKSRRPEFTALASTHQTERSAVSLRAETHQTKAGPVIHLQWDPFSQPIRRASSAMLYIYDGGTPIERLLNRRVLDSGFTDYSPATDEIGFHLVLEKGRPGGESVLVLFGTREAFHARLESEH